MEWPTVTAPLLEPRWEHGYESHVPNEYDEVMASFKMRHAGMPGVFLGRSPWIAEDKILHAHAVHGECILFTANMGINHHRAHYCYHGFDLQALEAISIRSRPEVTFIAGASQRAVEHQRKERHHNLYLHTDPAVNLLHYQQLCDTHHPRPWNCTVSGHRAVYWMHYMGLDPIYLLGVDYAAKGGIYYGDSRTPGFDAVEDNRQWLGRMREMVAALRAKEVRVIWPGEERFHG